MAFVNWLAGLIAKAVVDKVTAQLNEYIETKTKLNAITGEAKSLMGELDNAQSEAERKAILRKISNFSDVSKSLL